MDLSFHIADSNARSAGLNCQNLILLEVLSAEMLRSPSSFMTRYRTLKRSPTGSAAAAHDSPVGRGPPARSVLIAVDTAATIILAAATPSHTSQVNRSLKNSARHPRKGIRGVMGQ